MKRFRRPDARFHLVAAFAIVLGLSIWVSLALLAQLSSMSELTAAATQKFSIHGAKNISHAHADYTSARWWTGLCIAANIALTIVLGLWLRAEIARPVQAAAAVLRRIADGDLRSRPAANEVDQGPLLGAMQDMHDKLVTMVARVRAGSEHLSRGAGAIADGSRDLSARSAQQAASLAQAAAAMQALGAELERQGEQARQAAGTAHSAADSAARSAAAVADAATAVAGLDHAARRISGIAGAIDGIAFQSNIVALSAAVEAAQAGEHGAGFGKVAGEVRELALRAAGAARDIQSALGDAGVRIAAGHALTRRAADQLGDAAGGLQQAASQIGGMAEAAAPQRAGVIQLGRAMTALDTATRHHAQLLDETAASAAQMRDQAGSLSHLAGAYQLGPEYGTPAPRIVLVASNPGKLTTPARAFRRHAGVVPVRLKHGGAQPDAAC